MSDKKMFIICWEGDPCVALEYKPGVRAPSQILDKYAEDYAMERNKLSYAIVAQIEMS